MNDNGFYLLGHGRLWVRVLVWQGRGGLQGRGLYRSRDLHWGPGAFRVLAWGGGHCAVSVCVLPFASFIYLGGRPPFFTFQVSCSLRLTQTHQYTAHPRRSRRYCSRARCCLEGTG